MDQSSFNEQPGSLWWVLGMDTSGAWHERRIIARDMDQVNAWWQERTGRLPDIAWEAQEALDKIEQGLDYLNQWPSLEDNPKTHWFLGWMGDSELEKAALVAVPASDADHAALVLHKEKPGCVVRILGDAQVLSSVASDLKAALCGHAGAIDEDLLPKPPQHLSEDFSLWLAKQFDLEHKS